MNVQRKIPEVMIITEMYFSTEKCFLRISRERMQLVTSEPARNTICNVSGMLKEKDQLLMTETDTNRATSNMWRRNGMRKPSDHLK